MSRLQSALRAMPAGSIVTPALWRDHKDLAGLQALQGRREVERAKAIQSQQGCSWAHALRQACAPSTTA
jgi:hypothetical protein